MKKLLIILSILSLTLSQTFSAQCSPTIEDHDDFLDSHMQVIAAIIYKSSKLTPLSELKISQLVLASESLFNEDELALATSSLNELITTDQIIDQEDGEIIPAQNLLTLTDPQGTLPAFDSFDALLQEVTTRTQTAITLCSQHFGLSPEPHEEL